MPAGKRRMQHEEGEHDSGSSAPKRVIALEVDMSNTSFAEGISPAFDPNRVLLRPFIFIRSRKKNKYISIGYYPTRNYQPLVETRGPEKSPIILTHRHVRLMAEHLPAQCEAPCNDAHYICRNEDFNMNTAVGYRVARVSQGKRYICFKLHELRNLSYIFFMVRNLLTRYTESMNDVMNYVTTALYSNKFFEPPINASNAVLYYHLFEELKSIV